MIYSRPIRVAYILNNPTPYRTPMEVQLAQRTDLDLKVFYCSETEYDKDWNVQISEGKVRFLPGWHPRLGEETWFHWNPSIIQALRDGEFDVIVVAGYIQPTMVIALLWARMHKVPYIIHSESNLRKPRGLVKRVVKSPFVRAILSGASAGLAIGRYAKAYLNHYGIPEQRIFIFPNTPDVDYFAVQSTIYRKRKSEIKRSLGIDAELLVSFVGKFVQRKRVDLLLDAICKLQKDEKIPASTGLLLVGDGPRREQWEATTRKLGIENVYFMGFQQLEDLPQLYAISDLFVLPSQHETWGVVVNEAMACRLPVIVTEQVGASGDLVKEGENGYIVPVDDVDALCRAMKRVLCNPKLRMNMGEASQRIIRDWNYEMGVENFIEAVRLATNWSSES